MKVWRLTIDGKPLTEHRCRKYVCLDKFIVDRSSNNLFFGIHRLSVLQSCRSISVRIKSLLLVCVFRLSIILYPTIHISFTNTLKIEKHTDCDQMFVAMLVCVFNSEFVWNTPGTTVASTNNGKLKKKHNSKQMLWNKHSYNTNKDYVKEFNFRCC